MATEPHGGTPADDTGAHRPHDEAHQDLLARWHTTLLAAREGAEGPDPAPYGRALLDRWAEPHRRYHGTDHLRAVLDHVDELAAHLPGPDTTDGPTNGPADGPTDGPTDGPEADPQAVAQAVPGNGRGLDPAAVRLAAWFHDAVYRPDRSENEERSARLAERALTEAGVPAARVAEVARLVRLTVTHDPADDDLNGAVLCDADLAVLAGTPEQYAHYAAEIRQEYAFVPDDAFRDGRSAVLRQLLGLPRLFRTAHARTRWEAQARHNLTTELALLSAG
ncbi:hypothetical protein [Streptomyces albus]|uniref:hypothetical protein n=1 Tax=Streptomyces albus TaxID=1888 RepID=UPI0033C22EEA